LPQRLTFSEAFGTIGVLRNILLSIVVVSSMAITVIALSFTRFLAAPIIALTEKTRSIMQGRLYAAPCGDLVR
jgi:nitrogen fixation/metabolism regulation signal transduction histidine kinase